MSKKMKSAYELAMDRLKSKDPSLIHEDLDEEIKSEIAEIRKIYRAKRAEREIMFKSKMGDLRQLSDPKELLSIRTKLEDEYKFDLAELDKEEEEKVKKIRGR